MNVAILDEINSTNYSSVRLLYKPTVGYSGFVTTLKLKINLKSIFRADFPYIPDDTPADVVNQIFQDLEETLVFKEVRILSRKDPGPWFEIATIRIYNKEPFYNVNLMPYYADSNTIDVAEDLSLGVQLAIGNTLATNDKILAFGTVIEEKKNNGNEELAARIAVLEASFGTRAPLASPVFTGFTTFGDNLSSKRKLLTGITATSQGGSINIAHGISPTRIVSATGGIYYGTQGILPFNSRQSGCGSFFATDATNFSLTNEAGNSSAILSKLFYAVIEYVP